MPRPLLAAESPLSISVLRDEEYNNDRAEEGREKREKVSQVLRGKQI